MQRGTGSSHLPFPGVPTRSLRRELLLLHRDEAPSSLLCCSPLAITDRKPPSPDSEFLRCSAFVLLARKASGVRSSAWASLSLVRWIPRELSSRTSGAWLSRYCVLHCLNCCFEMDSPALCSQNCVCFFFYKITHGTSQRWSVSVVWLFGCVSRVLDLCMSVEERSIVCRSRYCTLDRLLA